MAYISADESRRIKKELKKIFPAYKFSVTVHHGSSLTVALMESDLSFNEGHIQINHYYIKDHWQEKDPVVCEVLLKIKEIINGVKQHEVLNAGDPYADYHECNFYYHIDIGKWDQHHKTISKEKEPLQLTHDCPVDLVELLEWNYLMYDSVVSFAHMAASEQV